MKDKIISDLDNIVSEIKAKDNGKSFSHTYLIKFEFCFILVIAIIWIRLYRQTSFG